MRALEDTRDAIGRPGLFASEKGETCLTYAIILGVLVGIVVMGASLVGTSSRDAFSKLATNTASPSSATATTPTAQEAPAPRGGSPLRDPRLWIQCAAIIVGFCIYYGLSRRQAWKELQEELEMLDVRIGTQEEVEAKLFAKRQEILLSLSKHQGTLAGGQLSVRHLMTTRLVTVGPRASLEESRNTMADNKLRHLLVCQDQRLLGVISDRDLAKPGKTAADVMARKPVTVEPQTALSPAVTLMMRKRISCLPVVEGEKLVGLFTTTDLIMTLQCAFQLLQNASEHLPAANGSSPTASSRPETIRNTPIASKA
jgi:acetoin utilization protein AcuB